jgi:thiol-disulfide isomerase/thioredoxin
MKRLFALLILVGTLIPASTLGETRGRAEIIRAPKGKVPVAHIVQKELQRAHKEGRELVVYVGAPWCEPCKRFHEAIEMGALDEVFPTLRLLEFDRGDDESRLAADGYLSRLIPLFVIPQADGRASEQRFEGSIKGPGAISNIVPRLKRMLATPRTEP